MKEGKEGGGWTGRGGVRSTQTDTQKEVKEGGGRERGGWVTGWGGVRSIQRDRHTERGEGRKGERD